MRLKTLFSGSFALAAMLFVQGCSDNNDEPSGAPSIELSASSITLDKEGGDQTIQVTASRDWTTDKDVDWVVVDPAKGSASSKVANVTVSVLPNSGLDRTATVKFTIGFDTKTLTVNQKGTGSASELVVYHNDFDKVEAAKTYGNGSSWPYLDQFDGWKNATGTGASAVSYSFNGMSARANSTSNGNYSDYSGSGKNNLFFGSNAYFSVQGISLPSSADYTLSFGCEKFDQDNGSMFKHEEFHVYVSNDAKKWVELSYAFPGADKDGRWDIATTTFTVPSGTSSLSIYVKADAASSYRLDDLDLSVASSAGVAIDFSKGVDLGTSGGSDTPVQGEIKDATVAEFIAAEVSTTRLYRLTGEITEIKNTTYGNLMLKDATGEVLIYGVKKNKDAGNTSFSELGAEVGDKLTVVGQRGEYNTTIEMKEGYCEKLEKDTTTPRLSVSTEKIEVNADVTSASFDVKGNVAWTVSSDNAAYTVSPASGNGDGSVKVTFPANTADADVTVNFTVSTTAAAAVKSYTVVLTHRGTSYVAPDYSSNVAWTLGENAYDETSPSTSAQSATVNGVAVKHLLKLGTSSKIGKATLTIPAGSTKLSFYGVAWKGTTVTVTASVGGTKVAEQAVAGNVGATSNPPYILTVTDSDHYTVTFPVKLASDTPVEVSTAAAGRVILFGINAE